MLLEKMTKNMDKIKQLIKEGIKEGGIEFINQLNKTIFDMAPYKHNPVGCVKWIHMDMVEANDYNPNLVASKELGLLAVSVLHDGYTQPIVTIYDDATIPKYRGSLNIDDEGTPTENVMLIEKGKLVFNVYGIRIIFFVSF